MFGKQNLKFFGDNHDEATAMIILKEALPLLKKYGYEALYLESPYDDAGINEVIELTEESIKMCTLFPDGTVPKKLSRTQRFFINSQFSRYGSNEKIADVIKKVVEGEKSHLESNKERVLMLKKLQELKMQLINIDVPRPYEYNQPGDLERRNIYMLAKIKQNPTPNGKGIVFVGFAHISDIWEANKFNIGLQSLVLKDETSFDAARCKAYYFYTKENAFQVDICKKIDICNPNIMKRIELIKIDLQRDQININKFMQNLHEQLEKEKNEVLIPDSETEKLSEYFVVSVESQKPGSDEQTIKYAESLGGRLKKRIDKDDLGIPFFDSLLLELPISVLTKAKRNMFVIDRLFLPKEEKYKLPYLKNNIKTLTIDKVISQKSNSKGYYLTFFDDSSLKGQTLNHITNREFVDLAKDAIEYSPVIEHLNTLNHEIRWRFKFLEKNPAAITEGFFNNEDGARLFLSKFQESGLENITLINDKDLWFLIVNDIDRILKALQSETKSQILSIGN